MENNNNSQKIHELKSWPKFFEKIIIGEKTHELRRSNDRVFSVGDQILLKEFDPRSETYTDREAFVKITYITDVDSPCAYSQEALKSNFCILSIKL